MDFSRYEKLRTLVRANFSEQTRALVDEALEYAGGKLAGLVRYDGSPLLEHAAAVASIVISEVGLGRNSTISAILHDVVRLAHKQLPAEEFLALSADIRKRFGDQVVGITLGLANISELKLKVAKEQADNFRDLIVSYSEDPRVILIKLADRLEVMRNLRMFPREKWRKKSWESLNLYAQIAHKLGLYNIKSELEDIALRYLIWYGAGRFWIEALRTDSLLLVPSIGLRASQLVAGIAVVAGIAAEVYFTRKLKDKPLFVPLALNAENKAAQKKLDGPISFAGKDTQLLASSPRKLFLEKTEAYNAQVKAAIEQTGQKKA